MNDIETRLRDALTARADLVQPEQLTSAAPIADFRPPWWHRSGPLLAMAAVAVLVIAVPFLALALTGGENKAGDRDDFASNSPAPTSSTPQAWYDQHPDGLPETWSEQQGVDAGEWLEGDLDGDGTLDQVRISGSEGNASLQVEAGGDSLTTPVEAGPNVTLGPLTEIEGSDTMVIPVAAFQGAAGTTYTTFHLYLVRDGELVEASVPESPTFGSQTSNLTEADGGRDTWRTWVDPAGGIFTMKYDDAGTPITDDGYPGRGAFVYRNTFYRWTLDGTTLTATEIGQGCTVKPETTVYGCP